VAEVAVAGLITVKPEEVRKAMATRVGLPFHPATYREDFDRIYALGLFENVLMERPELGPAGVRVTVRVRERPIIDSIDIRGNNMLSANNLKDAARGEKDRGKEGWKPRPVLTEGGRYDPFLAHQMEQAFRELYRQKDFAQAAVNSSTVPVAGRPGHVAVCFDIVEDRPVIISRVVLRGCSALPEGKVLADVQNRTTCWLLPAKAYDPEALKLDALKIQDVYRNSGYSDARVTALPPEIGEPVGWRQRRRATVTFEIHEGRMYVYGPVSFTGLTLASEQEARKRAGLIVGRPYSDEEVYAAAKRVEALLGEHGRPFARAEPRRQETAEAGMAAVRFVVSEGPEATVGEVRIKGNTFTQDRIIRRELEIFPGDIYDSRRVATSDRNLRRRGLFEKVNIRPEPGEEPDVADLEVEVKELDSGMLNVGAFVSPDDGSVGGMISLTESNFDWRNPPRSWEDVIGRSSFRGGGQTLSLRAAMSDVSQGYGIDYTNPWIWDTPEHYSFGFSLFRTLAQYADFETDRTGGSVRLGRRLFDPCLHGYVQYTIQNVYMSGVAVDAPDVLQDEEGTTLFSSGKVGLTLDTLDNGAMPSKGLLLRASEEVFGGIFGGDHDIRKTELEGNLFLTLFRTGSPTQVEAEGRPAGMIAAINRALREKEEGYPHVLHLRVAADWANPYGRDDIVPPSERYFAGGIGTVRGYQSRTITPRIGDYGVGGDFMLVENAEYMFPLYQDYLRGVLFFDAGNVWPEEGDFAIHDQRLSYGGGFMIRVPAALGPQPIKLYFCKALNPRRDEETQFFQMSFSFLF
jgi:outer membrane protein insertion porin family